MLFLHLDYLTCLGTFSRSGSWWMGSSQQPSNTSPVSICSAPGGLSVSFLLSLKTGPQRLQATFSSMRMWCVCGRGHSKGHSKYISGLSCAVETQLRGTTSKGLQRCQPFLCDSGSKHLCRDTVLGPQQRPRGLKYRLWGKTACSTSYFPSDRGLDFPPPWGCALTCKMKIITVAHNEGFLCNPIGIVIT